MARSAAGPYQPTRPAPGTRPHGHVPAPLTLTAPTNAGFGPMVSSRTSENPARSRSAAISRPLAADVTPMWKGLKETAHTLLYDWAALGKHMMYGAPLNPDEWGSVTMPTLVVTGAKSPAVLQQGSRALAEVLANAELRLLAGVSHNLKMNVLAPVLAEFLTGKTDIAVPGNVGPAAG